MIFEITNEEEFKHFKSLRDCYIVITDTIRNTIHAAGCDNVNITSFRTKVLNNNGLNGGYYFTDDLVGGREKFHAEKCQNCRPR